MKISKKKKNVSHMKEQAGYESAMVNIRIRQNLKIY